MSPREPSLSGSSQKSGVIQPASAILRRARKCECVWRRGRGVGGVRRRVSEECVRSVRGVSVWRRQGEKTENLGEAIRPCKFLLRCAHQLEAHSQNPPH